MLKFFWIWVPAQRKVGRSARCASIKEAPHAVPARLPLAAAGPPPAAAGFRVHAAYGAKASSPCVMPISPWSAVRMMSVLSVRPTASSVLRVLTCGGGQRSGGETGGVRAAARWGGNRGVGTAPAAVRAGKVSASGGRSGASQPNKLGGCSTNRFAAAAVPPSTHQVLVALLDEVGVEVEVLGLLRQILGRPKVAHHQLLVELRRGG